ncbi:Serine/threonine-protein kinase Nek5 (Never in mitosis A-related kinase 5) (NimA-related protein kinase 5) [Durusdinium trenchii]|uniref:non-specific serine/threonine protein kinase n=1 Tax=Durusdinium trenchii TaxID=1381693 RepID=A0ABP0N9S6_9DINO
MDRSVLATRLHGRGFQVVEPFKCAGHASIFRVRENEEVDTEPCVAKVVCLSGLDAQGQAGAQQEVSLLKGLSAHPNLIAYKQSFLEDGGVLFIIMTLAEDGDLCRVVSEAQLAHRALPEAAVLTWLRQTLLGLEHLHNQGVVHRDLKSSNIFLCEGRRRIRIGDFGISTVLQSTAFASSCVGTPAYMSPELMRNERYDFHVDMWALGCICFELCSLDLPFAAASLLQLAMQVMDSEPAWHKLEGRSEELISANRWLLQKEVMNRPTARSLLQEPLFVEGGRASIGPSEEEWLSLAAPDHDGSWSQEYLRVGKCVAFLALVHQAV